MNSEPAGFANGKRSVTYVLGTSASHHDTAAAAPGGRNRGAAQKERLAREKGRQSPPGPCDPFPLEEELVRRSIQHFDNASERISDARKAPRDARRRAAPKLE